MTEGIINSDGSRNWQANILLDNVRRLEQENKALKDNNNHLQVIIDDGRAENKRFREENKDLKKQIESQKGLITVGGKQQYEMTMAYDKFKTALEEIRNSVINYLPKENYKFARSFNPEEFELLEKILTKINEVLE